MHSMPDKSDAKGSKSGPLVELRGVDVTFGRHPVLRNISLSISTANAATPSGATSKVSQNGMPKRIMQV